jgi:hypothetical protein
MLNSKLYASITSNSSNSRWTYINWSSIQILGEALLLMKVIPILWLWQFIPDMGLTKCRYLLKKNKYYYTCILITTKNKFHVYYRYLEIKIIWNWGLIKCFYYWSPFDSHEGKKYLCSDILKQKIGYSSYIM